MFTHLNFGDSVAWPIVGKLS